MAAQRKPNLILFLPDQQRADTLACYGGVKVHAPNLNKLASESVIFERTYVTHPVCTPSRSSLMTGTWPHINGCTHNSVPLDRRFRVFPELMQDQDYRTAYIGKWHLGEDGRPPPAGADFSIGFLPMITGTTAKFLISKGIAPDKANGRFSEVAISNLPIELSRPSFLRNTRATLSKNISAIRSFWWLRSWNRIRLTMVRLTMRIRSTRWSSMRRLRFPNAKTFRCATV